MRKHMEGIREALCSLAERARQQYLTGEEPGSYLAISTGAKEMECRIDELIERKRINHDLLKQFVATLKMFAEPVEDSEISTLIKAIETSRGKMIGEVAWE